MACLRILRNSVSKSFKALQSGYVPSTAAGEERRSQTNDEDALGSLTELDVEVWPLFLRAHSWLRLLDATLERPFFTAAERAAAAANSSGWHSEVGVLDSLLEDEFEGEEEEDDLEGEEREEVAGGQVGGQSDHPNLKRIEMTYTMFETLLWPHMITHDARAAQKHSGKQLEEQARGAEMLRNVEKHRFKASMVFREICSVRRLLLLT